jgi:hypothetical protein
MTEMNLRTVHDDRLQVRVPPDVRAALQRGAVAARCGPGEFARRVILSGLRAEGVTLPPVPGAEA